MISLFTGLALAVIAIAGYIDFFSPNPSVLVEALDITLRILIPLVVIFSIAQGFFYLKTIADIRHRKMLLIFTSLFLGIAILLSVNITMNMGILSDIAVLLPWGLILLIFLVKKLNEFYLLKPSAFQNSKELEKIYVKYKITKREQEIIALICLGKTNRDIEDALFISIHTVRNHIYNIFQKLNVKNRVELINFIRMETSSREIGSENI
jgi:DNA-binding CsgD family transcriptional regulator